VSGASSSPLYGVPDPVNANHVIWGTTGGAEVSFLKVDGFGKPLAGAKFSLYTNMACTSEKVTVTLGDGTSVTEVVSNDAGQVSFRAPVGVYYMKETQSPTGYEPNNKVYIVLVGGTYMAVPAERSGEWAGVLSGIQQGNVNSQRGTLTAGKYEKDSAIFQLEEGKAVTTPDIAAYGIMNVSTTQPKMILRKIDESYTSLEGAVFEIYSYDMTKLDLSSDNLGPSDVNGVFFIGNLPYGYYYLHETTCPDGIKTNPSGDGWWYTLRVDEQGTVMLRGGAPSAERYDPKNP